MKLRVLAALAALPLLAGCAGTPVATSAPPAPSKAAIAHPAMKSDEPIVIDLARQVMLIPVTKLETLEVPILAAGDVFTGSSVATHEPEGSFPYVHCEDETLGWATEPDAVRAAEWARPIQFVTFDRGCPDISTISGHAVMLPDSIHKFDYHLAAGRTISFVGQSPYPAPYENSLKGADLGWPNDRPVKSVSGVDRYPQRVETLAYAATAAAEAFAARQITNP